jgi:hypothetical protein
MSKLFRVSAKGMRTNGKYFKKACVELYLNYLLVYIPEGEILLRDFQNNQKMD